MKREVSFIHLLVLDVPIQLETVSEFCRRAKSTDNVRSNAVLVGQLSFVQ